MQSDQNFTVLFHYLQPHLNRQKTQAVKAMLFKNNTAGGLTIPDCKLYSRAMVIKTAWHWHKNQTHTSTKQREDLSTGPCNYSHFTSRIDAKTTHQRKDSIFPPPKKKDSKKTIKE